MKGRQYISLTEEGNPIGDGGEGLAGGGKTRPPHSLTSPLAERNLIPPQEQKCIKNKCLNQRSRDESDLTEEKQGTSKRIGNIDKLAYMWNQKPLSTWLLASLQFSVKKKLSKAKVCLPESYRSGTNLGA
ncbi:hypothetical protein HZ326_1556 [Fusarium oxysporum f. sp. albedinis]|nr:hypothetical protein HZ326_1556 [Fusarium oxysporum f. sp. albedinis]